MSDYSTAASSALTSLNAATDGGMVEEYEVSANSRRVRRGKAEEQVKAALLLEGIAARRSAGGMFTLAKRQEAE